MKLRRLMCSVAILAALPMTACSQTPLDPRYGIERRDGSLMFSGDLSSQAVEDLLGHLRHDDVLIIQSEGGLRASSVALGRAIVEKNITIDVNGSCYSACALFLALPARRTIVGEGATMLFHNSTTEWTRLLVDRPTLFSEDEAQEIRQADREQRELLAAGGVSPDILMCIDRALQPDLAAARRTTPIEAIARGDAKPGVAIPTAYDFVWLSPTVLHHYGARHIETSWTLAPQARGNLETMIAKKIAWIDTPEQCE